MRLRATILTITAAGLMGCHGQLAIGGSDGVGTGADETGGNSGITDAGGATPDTGWPVPDAAVPDTGIPLSDAPNPFNGAPGSSIVSALDDTQANALCNWLADEFAIASPGDPASSDPTQGMPSGFATGPGIGCGPASPGLGIAVGWTLLGGQYCVANLRQGSCAGTVGDLVQCAHYIGSEHDIATNPAGDCNAIAAMCDPFTSAAGCTGTVFWPGDTGPTNSCLGALPIAPDAGACDAGN